MELVTDWIRAAVAGPTVDGRNITAEQLEQIGASYSREVYSARIWSEHIRGIIPDGAFDALGDVIAAKSAVISSGDLKDKTALYVKITPQPKLIESVRKGQKVHLSIEIHPDFQGTGNAYLIGMGVTDSPASIGTEILKFSTNRQSNMFSAPVELVQDFSSHAGSQSAGHSNYSNIC